MEPPKKVPKLQISKGNTISTESCATILKYFYKSKNKKPYFFLTRTCTKRGKGETHPHPLFVALPQNTFRQDFDGQLPEHYFEKFMYKSTFPRVISVMNHIEQKDPLTQHMIEKNNYIDKCKRKIASVRGSAPFEPAAAAARCSPRLLELVARLEADPDPVFHSHYNWYYAGNGNLHLVDTCGGTWLLHAELNVLYITPFSIETLTIDYNRSFAFPLDSNILETAHCAPHVAVRTRHHVTVLRLVSGTCPTLERLADHESRRPFTAINFDPHHKTVLYATTLDAKVHIINLNFVKKRTVRLTPAACLVDNWNAAVGIERETYAHVTRDVIEIYDKRVNRAVHSVRDLSDYAHLSCDRISAARPCGGAPLMYVGTNHHLYLLDMRYTGGSQAKPVQRWTHNMISPTAYMSACKFELTKDMLCLSSQWYEDTVVLTNDSACFTTNSHGNSIAFPFRPPTVEDALIEARCRGLCVNVYHPIDRRLYSALTGNAVFQRGEEYVTLTQNSLGDIFCHTLYADHETREDNAVERLHEWCRPYSLPTDAEVTGVADIAPTWRELRRPPEDFTLGAEKLNSNIEYNFTEEDLLQMLEGNKIDRGLLDVWLEEQEEQAPSLAIERDYSDSD